jgi:transcriptional regulator with XRE-family HTH domain
VNRVDLGKRLKIARVTKGDKQQDLAQELGINRSVLNLYENSKRNISSKHEGAIRKYINETK